jgi:hypothetical protein
MPMDLRFSLPATGITIVVAIVVVVRAAAAPAPAPAVHPPTKGDLVEVTTSIATQEKEWLKKTGENFPRDNWSQSDDFHGLEFREMTRLAREKGLRVEDVLRAVDDDMHRLPATRASDPDTRAAHAVPCKPRPFYD